MVFILRNEGFLDRELIKVYFTYSQLLMQLAFLEALPFIALTEGSMTFLRSHGYSILESLLSKPISIHQVSPKSKNIIERCASR